MKKSLLISLAALALATAPAVAADFYVSTSGDDSNPGTQAKPFGSPEAAFLAVANEGSTPCNVYLEEGATFMVGAIRIEDNCVVKVYGNNTTLKADVNSGRNDGQGLRIMRLGKDTDVEISGVNFVNGRQTDYFAGGAIFSLGKKLIVDNCSFIDNEAGSAGGAIASRGHYVKVTNSYFEGNFTRGGGASGAAISMVGNAEAEHFGELVIENCAFVGNEAMEGGGHATVISIYDSCLDVNYSLTGKVTITNCTFLNNKNVQPYQADIDVSDNSDCSLYMVNNTIVGSEVGLGLYFQAEPIYLFNNFIHTTKQGISSQLSVADGREPMIAANNVIIGGETAVNENIDDPMLKNGTAGNVLGLAADNSLASFAMSSNITREGNIGYLAIGATSKLINAGLENSSEYTGTNVIPTTDCRGYSRTGGNDIGAYEYSDSKPDPDQPDGPGDDNAVESIEYGSDAPAVYYNLQGVEVANPQNGIYIERRGNVARKVVINN